MDNGGEEVAGGKEVERREEMVGEVEEGDGRGERVEGSEVRAEREADKG